MRGKMLCAFLACLIGWPGVALAARGDVPKLDERRMEDKGFIQFNGYWIALMKREALIRAFPRLTVNNGTPYDVKIWIDDVEIEEMGGEEQRRAFLEPGSHKVVFGVRGRKGKPISFSVLQGKQSFIEVVEKDQWPTIDVRIPAGIRQKAEKVRSYVYAPRGGKDTKIILSKGKISRAYIKKAYTTRSEIVIGERGKTLSLDAESLREGKLRPKACYIFHSPRPGKFVSGSHVGFIIRDPESTVELAVHGVKLLKRGEHTHRALHIGALAEAHETSVKRDLLGILNDPQEHERVHTAVASALSVIATPQDVPMLERLKEKAEITPGTQKALEGTIAYLKEREQIPKLVKTLRTGDEREKIDAISALRDYAADVEPKVFVDVLKSADSDAMREIAAEGLNKIKRPEAMEALLSVAKDKNAVVRAQVAKSAGDRLSWKAIPILIGYAKDSDAGVRESACKALNKLGIVEAVPSLLDLLADPDGKVAQAAGEALKQITREGYPFDHNWPAKERKQAIKTWREWWEK